jgi:secreted trypsin-like serine protease
MEHSFGKPRIGSIKMKSILTTVVTISATALLRLSISLPSWSASASFVDPRGDATLHHRMTSSEAPPSLPSGPNAPQPRIVQGGRAEPTQRRFFALAGYDNFPQTSEILCGATLVSRDIAITAAHCQGGFNYGIRVLDANTGSYDRLIPVERQIRHPKWDLDLDRLNFDILVLKLATPLAADDAAQPIPYNTDANYPVDGQLVLAMGFGITESKTVSTYLRESQMEYITNEECWGRSIRFNNVQQGDEVMCTDPVAGSSTCMGDSGGPVTNVDGTLMLGLVSFGSGCEADQIPDGYARISAMADWIREQICELSDFAPSDCPLVQRNSLETKIRLHFQHDFWSDETTFAVRERTTRNIVHAGPQYTPERGASEIEEFFLMPGDYTFEVWDTDGSGLRSKGVGQEGSWYLTALYDGSTETRLAEGGADFDQKQSTDFSLGAASLKSSNPAMETCLLEKETEEIAGSLIGTSCQCSDSGELTCYDGSGQVCQRKNQSCVFDADCCNGRDCRANICRQRTSNNREDSKLGGSETGGASERRNGNNLLRRGK